VPHILLVDDEDNIRYPIKRSLERDGYTVSETDKGQEAIQLIQKQEFDLALLDLRLKDIHGLEVLAALRHHSPDTIAIILTGHGTLETSVSALRQGASDYLLKPCKTIDLRESIRRGLLERQQRLKQRLLIKKLQQLATLVETDIPPALTPEANTNHPPTHPDHASGRIQRYNNLVVDFFKQIITLEGKMLDLSPTEFDLLAYLISEAPRVISPAELVREVQEYNSETWEASQIIRQHIYRIRQKIKDLQINEDIIRTVRGRGYTLQPENTTP
jgi:DNA-binding response OmpR family regulator